MEGALAESIPHMVRRFVSVSVYEPDQNYNIYLLFEIPFFLSEHQNQLGKPTSSTLNEITRAVQAPIL